MVRLGQNRTLLKVSPHTGEDWLLKAGISHVLDVVQQVRDTTGTSTGVVTP